MLQTSNLICYYFFYFSSLALLASMFHLIVNSTSITLISKNKERKHCWALFDGTIWQMTTTKAIWITCSGYTVDTPSYIMDTGALQHVLRVGIFSYYLVCLLIFSMMSFESTKIFYFDNWRFSITFYCLKICYFNILPKKHLYTARLSASSNCVVFKLGSVVRPKLYLTIPLGCL